VIHSFAVPAFGVKMDAVPGRLTGAWTEITKPGIYYGQCSELCGKDHGFMPIEIHAVSKDEFAKWVVAKGGTMKGDTEKAPETAPAAVEPKDKKAN
jgi:cytochrome c oxidase subunit 2